MSFVALAREEPRAIAFGMLCMLASSPGQTFLIALFLPGMKGSFGLGDAEIANLYGVATVLSALVLWRIGRWIDRTDLLRYGTASAAFLLLACALAASAGSALVLAAGFFALRLGGQGLLTHVAATATGRYFTQDRGKALSLTFLGYSLGEAALPALTVALIGAWGWQAALVTGGVFSLLVVSGGAALVRGKTAFRRPVRASAMPAGGGRIRHAVPAASTRYFILTGPLFIATPLVVTALVFHQALIAHDKGVSLQWFAVSFTSFALVRLASVLLVGPAIDRFGSRWLFCLHLVPLAAGIALLASPASTAWSVPAYWMLAGISAGMAGNLQVAILAESVPPDRLGAVRSVFASAMILASALGPALYGWMLAYGVSVEAVLWGTAAAMLAATALGAAAPVPSRGRYDWRKGGER